MALTDERCEWCGKNTWPAWARRREQGRVGEDHKHAKIEMDGHRLYGKDYICYDCEDELYRMIRSLKETS